MGDYTYISPGANMANIKIQKIAKDWVQNVIDLMQQAILDQSDFGGQRFLTKIDYKVEEGRIILSFPEYGKWIDTGRRPGKMPPSSALTGWMHYHGIDMKWLFPIQRKIGREGIPPRPFIHIFEDELPELVNRYETVLHDQIMGR